MNLLKCLLITSDALNTILETLPHKVELDNEQIRSNTGAY